MILVTGANGFLGPHVVESLTEASPGNGVRAVLRNADERFSSRFPDVEVKEGDLRDESLVADAVAGVTAVVHLASKNIDRDGSGFDVNVESTEKLCRAAQAAGVRRLIYTSSVGVYGHGAHRGADETTPVRPDTALSISKAAAEAIVLEHHRTGAFRATVLRPRFVYGAGDTSLLPRLIGAARKYPFLISGGRARISLVLADDLAQVILRFATDETEVSGAGDPVLHVTSGETLSYRELVSTLCAAFGYRSPRFSLPIWLVLAPLLLRERLLGQDPETVRGISSLRVRMIAQDNEFSNHKLLQRFPDLSFTSFAEGFESSLDYYQRFA